MKKSNLFKILFLLMLLSLSCYFPVYAVTEKSGTYSFIKDYDAIDQAAKSVFYVEVYDRDDQVFGQASGFIAFDEHLFITNEHVIDGASYIKVWDEDNKMYFIDQVIAVDKVHDIAILLFPEGKNYAALEIDAASDLKAGQPILAIGSPKGFQGTVSVGKINAFVNVEMYSGAKCIQHTAPSSPGSSGGCLFADNGKVIGITSAGTSGEPVLNIAVPIKYLKSLYDGWNKRESKALDSGYYRNDDSSSVDVSGLDKNDFVNAIGGQIETFISIPESVELDDYFYPMYHMTANDFLKLYDEVRKKTVMTAPAITKLNLSKPFLWSDDYCTDFDLQRGVGTKIYVKIDDKPTLDAPITQIAIKVENGTKANARACVTVFTQDPDLFDKMASIYESNDCEPNNLYAAYLTKEGYLLLYSGNNSGDRLLEIYYVILY